MRRRRNFTGIYIVISLAIAFLAAQFLQLASNNNAAHDGELSSAPGVIQDAANTEPPAPVPLFAEYYERATELMDQMPLAAKVAQLFLVRFPAADALSRIAAATPGGFILFAKDFQYETPDSLRAKLRSLQDSTATRFLFGVDEEGGTVTRVSRFPAFRSAKFASPQQLYAEGGLGRIVADSHEKSALLMSLSLNLNLAPVADVPTSPSAFIYDRSLGQDAATTADYVAAVATAMREDGVISTLKHFPGYGDNADTHTGIAIDRRSYDALAADFLPFISGIAAGSPTVLVSHNIITSIDANLPASLSPAVVSILRDELGFSGVIMTDDLAMDAVREYVASGQAAVSAVLAGNDLLITSDFPAQYQEVITAIDAGILNESRIDASVQRILAIKLAYGIIE